MGWKHYWRVFHGWKQSFLHLWLETFFFSLIEFLFLKRTLSCFWKAVNISVLHYVTIIRKTRNLYIPIYQAVQAVYYSTLVEQSTACTSIYMYSTKQKNATSLFQAKKKIINKWKSKKLTLTLKKSYERIFRLKILKDTKTQLLSEKHTIIPKSEKKS